MTAILRLATAHDAEAMLAIYAPIVRDTAISFEVEPPTEAEMRQRVVSTLPHLPWLVCERDGALLGYAYANPHRLRAAYQWSVEVSAYVHAMVRHSGVGRALYHALLKILALQGLYNAYAGITLPNPASIGLHESLGFQPIGVYRNVGYKLGVWHDVGWWQLSLRNHANHPNPPVLLSEVQYSTDWQAAMTAALKFLRV